MNMDKTDFFEVSSAGLRAGGDYRRATRHFLKQHSDFISLQ